MIRFIPLKYALPGILAILFTVTSTSAYVVTDLKANYRNGQVFITWTNPSVATPLQYNVYRSSTKIKSALKIIASNHIGFVRDRSAQNIFWSQQAVEDVYYRIEDGAPPLSANQGLYVVTCNDNNSYYYAVTVTDLATGYEDKLITLLQNSLSTPVAEAVEKPQPVWQNSYETVNGEMKELYVQFGDNRSSPLYPALNSVGSFGFNFWLVKRGTADTYPLFILFEGFGGKDADKNLNLDSKFTNCYVMGVYDWLPIPTLDGDTGDNSFFLGWHEDYNIYSDDNPVPASGVIRTYPQKRYQEAIQWGALNFNLDTTRIYLKGSSANGYGALLMATIYPEKIAAVYATVEPNSVNSSTETYQQMWGEISTGLRTDVTDWNTGDTLSYPDLKDIQKMVNRNEARSLPPIYDVHGKNDLSVIWNDGKIKWLDSLDANHIGGIRFWDQRDHGGGDKNFENEETEPDYFRFATNKAYPAFSKCSINQDPGNGSPTNGDPYGAMNGCLDWRDSTDDDCKFWMNLFIRDFYVGGVLHPEQHETCTAHVTFRRMQNFHPQPGTKLKWFNYDASGIKIQKGTFTYNGGLLTLKNVIINKSGNLIKIKIENCQLREEEDETDKGHGGFTYARIPGGYRVEWDPAMLEPVQVRISDLLGRTVWVSRLDSGTGELFLPSPGNGLFVVTLMTATSRYAEKLYF